MKKATAQTENIMLTRESYDSLVAELARLKDKELPRIIYRIAKAREQGDLSENSEYHDAKDQQELMEVRIDEIEQTLAKSKIVKDTKSVDKAGVGSVVEIKIDGKKAIYTIVGEFDKDADKSNVVTATSPLGKAICGKKAGENSEIVVPVGTRKLQIISIK